MPFHGWIPATLIALLGLSPCHAAASDTGATTARQEDNAVPKLSLRGCDVSSLARAEALGARFFDASGAPSDALTQLARHGVNIVRLKAWVDSPCGYHNAASILPQARRAHELGMGILLCIHYSDTWADPAHQSKPAAWKDFDLAGLEQVVETYTRELCAALVRQGTPPAIVQVGNEINMGMLWPEGRVADAGRRFEALARLLQAGIRGAKAAAPDTSIALQLGSASDRGLIRWWFDGVRGEGVEWDYTSLSYYPWLHGAPEDLQPVLNDTAARYERPVLIMETSYPFTLENADPHPNIFGPDKALLPGHPATPEGQASFLTALAQVVSRIPENRGAGIIYWEGAWIPVTGNGWDNRNPASGNPWDNQTLFTPEGRPLPGLRALGSRTER